MSGKIIYIVLFLTMCVVHHQAYTDTYLFDCHDIDKVPLFYKADQAIELCCNTTFSDCVTNHSLVRISKDETGGELATNWTQVHPSGNISSVKLTIPSPQVIDSGTYACYCNGSRRYPRKVYVIEKIDPPKIISFTSKLKRNVTVKFFPGKKDSGYTDNYDVSVKIEAETVVLCTNRTIFCRMHSCKCTNKLIKGGFDYSGRYKNVTIVVTRVRSFTQKAEARMVVNVIQHVKPGQVTKLGVEDKTAESVILALCAPNNFYLVITQMNFSKHPLTVAVKVVKTQGFNEERKFNITFKSGKWKCLRVGLSGLSPFTTYSVTVTAAGGGGSGKPRTIDFTTSETIPLSPPENVLYWITKDEPGNYSNDSNQQKDFSLNINWKPIPHDKKGGDISYRVLVSYEYNKKKLQLDPVDVKQCYVVLRGIPDTNVAVEIYAKNDMGISKSYSHLEIPRYSVYSDIHKLDSHVESGMGKAEVFIQRPPSTLSISGIYTCVGFQDKQLPTQVVCKEFPQIVSNDTNFDLAKDMLRADVSLDKRQCPGKTTVESKYETCCFYRNLKDSRRSSPNIKNVTAIRSFTIQNDSCVSPFQYDDGMQLSKTDPSVQQKFMFSIKGSHRLFPFKCYYNSKFTSVELIFNQSMNGDVIWLGWRQRCDFNSAKQFLAKYYHVYPSHDAACPDPEGNFTEIENTIMQQSVIEVPEPNIYACVESFKSSELTIPTSKAIHYKVQEYSILSGGGGGGLAAWAVIVICVIILLLTGITVIVIWFCRRKDKVRHDKDFERLEFIHEYDKKTQATYSFETKEKSTESDSSGLGSLDGYENMSGQQISGYQNCEKQDKTVVGKTFIPDSPEIDQNKDMPSYSHFVNFSGGPGVGEDSGIPPDSMSEKSSGNRESKGGESWNPSHSISEKSLSIPEKEEENCTTDAVVGNSGINSFNKNKDEDDNNDDKSDNSSEASHRSEESNSGESPSNDIQSKERMIRIEKLKEKMQKKLQSQNFKL